MKDQNQPLGRASLLHYPCCWKSQRGNFPLQKEVSWQRGSEGGRVKSLQLCSSHSGDQLAKVSDPHHALSLLKKLFLRFKGSQWQWKVQEGCCPFLLSLYYCPIFSFQEIAKSMLGTVLDARCLLTVLTTPDMVFIVSSRIAFPPRNFGCPGCLSLWQATLKANGRRKNSWLT